MSYIQNLTLNSLKFSQGSLFDPQSAVWSNANHSETMGAGAEDGPWRDVGSFTVAITTLTETVAFWFGFNQIAIPPVVGVSLVADARLVRAGATLIGQVSQVHPGGLTLPPVFVLRSDLSPPATPGNYTYTLQLRLVKISGDAGTYNWSYANVNAFLLAPKSGV